MPQFKSINSSTFSLLSCPTLTSLHDYKKNHSFDYTDLTLFTITISSPSMMLQMALFNFYQFSLVQSLSHVLFFVTPWTASRQASLSITSSWSLFKCIELVMPSNHLILCCLILLPPSIFLSIRVFANELVLCIR